jgi:hypothetical protein
MASSLCPIVIMSKKNGKLQMCVDFRKLNAATNKDPYPIPFINKVLDAIIGHALYTFLHGFCGYNQLSIAKQNKYKIAFVTKWGTFVWLVMPFGLNNTLATYQRLINEAFRKYLNKFMKLFLDDFSVFLMKTPICPNYYFVSRNVGSLA